MHLRNHLFQVIAERRAALAACFQKVDFILTPLLLSSLLLKGRFSMSLEQASQSGQFAVLLLRMLRWVCRLPSLLQPIGFWFAGWALLERTPFGCDDGSLQRENLLLQIHFQMIKSDYRFMMQCADGIARIHLLINGKIINSLLLNRLFCLVSEANQFIQAPSFFFINLGQK